MRRELLHWGCIWKRSGRRQRDMRVTNRLCEVGRPMLAGWLAGWRDHTALWAIKCCEELHLLASYIASQSEETRIKIKNN